METGGMKLRPRIRSEAGRIVLFLAAGLINTAFGYGVYALCVAAGCGPALSVIVSTVAGVCFNYCTLGAVFVAQRLARLPRFLAVYAVLAPMNIALVGLAEHAGVNPYLGGAFALAVVTPLTYVSMRLFVFAPASVSDRLA
jgi:putative flippase GtrA